MDMDMGMSMFLTVNERIAHIFWYMIAAFTGIVLVTRLINELEARSRLNRSLLSKSTATRPASTFFQYWATATTVLREIRHPAVHINNRFLSWLSPPSLGRSVVLLCYWLVVFLMSTDGAVIKDAYYWERIGYRNAWTTMMQLPLVFLLANKTNPWGVMLGISHERLNWFHRWVGRTMLLTATLHGWFFYYEWDRANFVELEIETMPMVKYGLGAWGLLLWNVLSSMAPLRKLAYEVFVIQHLASIALLLWCIHTHVPSYAKYNLWWAVGLWGFDRAARGALYAYRNINLSPKKRTGCHGKRLLGLEATAAVIGSQTTVVTLKSVHFKWQPGQYVYLWAPALGPFEAHPYTVASAHRVTDVCTCNSVQLVIHKHTGFSKRLHSAASKAKEKKGTPYTFTAFVAGPYGGPPRADIYENLVLIGASTGASFTLPILEGVVETQRRQENSCLRRVDYILTARDGEEVDWYIHRLGQIASQCQDLPDFKLNISIFKTNSSAAEVEAKTPLPMDDVETGANCCQTTAPINLVKPIIPQNTRADLPEMIRQVVELAVGETSVIACGGKVVTTTVRNTVASLSDERAVHKGTGAQGIHLYIEEFSF